MRVFNSNYNGKSLTIECISNGYLISCNDLGDSFKLCAENLEKAFQILSEKFGCVDIGERVVLSATRERQESGPSLGGGRALPPTAESRPWGYYEVLAEGAGYKVKKLLVTAGYRLSLQSHSRRSERWSVVSGIAEVEVDGVSTSLRVGESLDIPVGAKHRLSNSVITNPGREDVIIIEVQFGDYLGEDDIIRYADDFGRVEMKQNG